METESTLEYFPRRIYTFWDQSIREMSMFYDCRPYTMSFGKLDSISYSVSRNTTPIYSMGTSSESIDKVVTPELCGCIIFKKLFSKTIHRKFSVYIEAENEVGRVAWMSIKDIQIVGKLDDDDFKIDKQYAWTSGCIGNLHSWGWKDVYETN
jgi:hypothetical protein